MLFCSSEWKDLCWTNNTTSHTVHCYFTVENCTKIAGFFFYLFDDHVCWTLETSVLDTNVEQYVYNTKRIELRWSLICSVTPETDSCTLPKAKTSLGYQDFAHYSNWRWWRRAAWLAHFSPPKHQSMTCQRLSADLPIKLSASVVSRLNPDWWRLVGKPKQVWASPPPVQPDITHVRTGMADLC